MLNKIIDQKLIVDSPENLLTTSITFFCSFNNCLSSFCSLLIPCLEAFWLDLVLPIGAPL